jgi:glutathione synthase/RimK-type ligase-like ATP-grasp enzyme
MPQRPARSQASRDLLMINGDTFQPEHGESTTLKLRDVNTVFRGIGEIAFSIEPGQTRVYETVSGRDLAEFALIQVIAYPRPTATLLSAISSYLRHHGRPELDETGISAPTKLYQLMTLAQNGLPVPATVYLPGRLLRSSFATIADRLGLPFVLKTMHGSGGRLNFLINTEADFERLTGDPAHGQVAFLAQQFVANNGTFRILVFGRDIRIVMHRCNTDGTHLTNTERGSHATLFEPESFDAGVMAMVARATSLMRCEVAGVNVVQDRHTQQWYLLEVNCAPAIGSGMFAAQKTRAYAEYLQSRLSA